MFFFILFSRVQAFVCALFYPHDTLAVTIRLVLSLFDSSHYNHAATRIALCHHLATHVILVVASHTLLELYPRLSAVSLSLSISSFVI